MLSTAKVAHPNYKSNKITKLSRSSCAMAGLLEKIMYPQFHVQRFMPSKTNNLRIVQFVSLLAVFPRMGIYAYEISQNELAEKMLDMFGFRPTRQTISKWELALQKMGYLNIPRHVDWRNYKTKIRVFTEEFWHLARFEMPFLSYNCPQASHLRGPVERVEQVVPKDPVVNNSVTQIRATKAISNVVAENHTEPVLNKIPEIKKPEQPRQTPPKNKKMQRSDLTKFEKKIRWWIYGTWGVSDSEASILTGIFLSTERGGEYYRWLSLKWREARAERPYLIRDLIRYLREKRKIDDSRPQLQVVTDDTMDTLCHDAEKTDVLSAMMWGYEYMGPCGSLIKQFRSADADERDEIMKNIDSLIRECRKNEKT